MASKKHLGGLWADDDSTAAKSKASASSSTNLSGSRFSTRDYAVDQSVNLMAMGEERPTNLSGAPETGGFASTVAGLFRASTGVEPPRFDEYGDAAASTESEEYISDKRRRMTPAVASIRSFVTTKAFFSLMLGLLGFVLLGGGIYLASTNTPEEDTEGAMASLIVDAGITPKKVLSDSSTPQSKALQWLAHQDGAKMKPEDKGFLDRYILAVFYFGSNDKLEGWKNSENWMTAKGICSWAGVECIPKSVVPGDTNNFQSEVRSYDANDAITALVLPGNNMEGEIPAEFVGFANMMTLDFSENEISGSIPSGLGDMPKIRDLILRKNAIYGAFPAELSKLKGLHQLLLGENQLDGTIPNSIQNMVNLRTLSLSSNSFSGSFPNVEPLKLLLNLHLDDNQFEEVLPNYLVTLTNLKDLRLSKNHFKGKFPEDMGSLRNLEVLRMDSNMISGTIPDMFDSTPRITDLQLQRNHLEGSIPRTLWHLSGVKHLALDNNKLTGTIGAGISLMLDVVTVALQLNKLTGSIPTNIGKLDDIAVFTVNSNQLTGSIPSQLGDCFRLQKIHLDQNKLAGNIPTELGKLDRLTELRLEFNDFSAISVPTEVCALTDNEELKHISSDCKMKMFCGCCNQCM